MLFAASAPTDAALQTTENDQEQSLETNIANLVSTVADEVAVATTELNLATDSNRFFDEGIYSDDSDDSGEEDLMYFL